MTKYREYRNTLNKLNQLDNIINHTPRDSEKFIKAESEGDEIIFHKLTPKDYALIIRYFGKSLTNKDIAKILVNDKDGQSIASALDLPIDVALILQLRFCQRKTGLNQSKFAKRYNIKQSQLSKMESGNQSVNINLLSKILKSLGSKFTLILGRA